MKSDGVCRHSVLFSLFFTPKTPGIRLHFPKIRPQLSLQGYTLPEQGYTAFSTVKAFNCRLYVTISVSRKSDGFLSARYTSACSTLACPTQRFTMYGGKPSS